MKKILIVDDDPGKRRILCRLTGGAYEVQCAINGEEGIATALSYLPDLILLDISMPVMDGFETCKAIRENFELKNTKVMMVTGRALQEERAKGMSLGANDYVALPFDEDELITRIELLLQLRAMEAEIEQLKAKTT